VVEQAGELNQCSGHFVLDWTIVHHGSYKQEAQAAESTGAWLCICSSVHGLCSMEINYHK